MKMRGKLVLMIAMGISSAVISGCSKVKNTVVQMKPAETLTGIVSFDFSYSSGTYRNSGNHYEAQLTKDGTVKVSIRRDAQEETKEFIAEPEFMEKLTAIANKYEVSKWDGFRGNNTNVLDGNGFGLSLKTDSDQSVSCGGYMEWPDGYGSMRAEVDTLFIDLYESVYPDKGKILQKYLDEEIIAKYGLASEKEFFLPYLAAEGPNGEQTYFERAVHEGPGGVIGYLITGFGDYGDYNEEDQLIVYYFTQEEDCWRLWFEMYHVQPDYSVKKVAEQLVDSNVLMNDGIYSYLFRYYHDGYTCLGYSGCQSSVGGNGSKTYFLEAFKLTPEGAEPYGDVLIEGSTDREEWTPEFISEMKELAVKAGLQGETSDWEERSWDPMVHTLGKDVTVFTTSNFKSGFNKAREGLKPGEKIGDFGITGTVTGCKYGK